MIRIDRPGKIITEACIRTTPHMLALAVGLRAWFQCKDGLYNYEDKICVTADECSSIGSDYHAYKSVGRCIYAEIYGDD